LFHLPFHLHQKNRTAPQAGSLHGIVGARARRLAACTASWGLAPPRTDFAPAKYFGSSPVIYPSVLQLSARSTKKYCARAAAMRAVISQHAPHTQKTIRTLPAQNFPPAPLYIKKNRTAPNAKRRVLFFSRAQSGRLAACTASWGLAPPRTDFAPAKYLGSSPVIYPNIFPCPLYIKKNRTAPMRSGAFYFFSCAQSAL